VIPNSFEDRLLQRLDGGTAVDVQREFEILRLVFDPAGDPDSFHLHLNVRGGLSIERGVLRC
jgi:hypothetical protein